MAVADFSELRVYQAAFAAAMELFELSKKFPAVEKYSLTDQLRRSSRSVCANIAEAWRKRRYEAAFVSKLSDADTEAAETMVHLEFAYRCGYVGPDVRDSLRERYDIVCRQLRIMMNDSARWCSQSDRVLEEPDPYHPSDPPL